MKRSSRTVKHQEGFTILPLVITIASIAVVSTFGVLGIRTARAEFRLQSSARLFASYIEKARADSVRRHAATGAEAAVEIFGEGTTSYAVTMDYGLGTVETRNFQLDPGIEFGTAAQKVTFDWRGRLTVQCAVTRSCVFQVRSPTLEKSIPVDVSGSGDITVDEQHFPDQLIPEIEISQVDDGDVDPEPAGTPAIEGTPTPDPVDPIDPLDPTPTPPPTATPTPTPHGKGKGNGKGNGNGNGTPSPTPTPTPTPVPTATPTPSPAAQCSAAISSPSLSLSQSDSTKKSGTVTYTIASGTGTYTVSATQQGNGNSLGISVSPQTISSNGSSVITISAKNGAGNRGVFTVQVSANAACGSTQTITVTVSN